MVKVNLRGRFGYGRPRTYYGPGVTDVPEGLARALGLQGMAAPTPDEEPHEKATLADWFGASLAMLLTDAGYGSVESVQAASDDDLLAIDGIGPASLKRLRSI